MEMKIDAGRVKAARERRAWSQSHLAEAADLGLRTVQRIETSGAASYESVLALASALSMPIAELIPPRQRTKHPRLASIGWVTSGVAAAVTCIGMLVLAATAHAEQVMLELAISIDGDQQAHGHLLIAEGKDAEMRIDDVVRFVVVPTMTDDGKVMLSTRVYEFDGRDYVLLDKPKLITSNQKQAEIRISSDSGNDYQFLITPRN